MRTRSQQEDENENELPSDRGHGLTQTRTKANKEDATKETLKTKDKKNVTLEHTRMRRRLAGEVRESRQELGKFFIVLSLCSSIVVAFASGHLSKLAVLGRLCLRRARNLAVLGRQCSLYGICECVFFCDVRDVRFHHMQSWRGCVDLDVLHGFAGFEHCMDAMSLAWTTEYKCPVASPTTSSTTRCRDSLCFRLVLRSS